MAKFKDTMNEFETASQTYLTRKIPCIIRVDGKNFKAYTKDMPRPFDDAVFLQAMRDTMLDMCKEIQGCVFGYTFSDEISFLLLDTNTRETNAFYNYRVQKVCSIAASMATVYFNKNFSRLARELYTDVDFDMSKLGTAMFDARTFSVPKEYVASYFSMRQQDCQRNSVAQVARMYYKPKELNQALPEGMSLKDKLKAEKGIDWESEYPTHLKQGVMCYKAVRAIPKTELTEKEQEYATFEYILINGFETPVVYRNRWTVNKDTPYFGTNGSVIYDCMVKGGITYDSHSQCTK